MNNKPLPAISMNALLTLAEICRLKDADAPTPTTAAAGANKQFRQGVAELRKAGVITTFANKFLRAENPGCVTVRFATEYKRAVSNIGVTDVCCAPRFLTYWGTLIDSRLNYA